MTQYFDVSEGWTNQKNHPEDRPTIDQVTRTTLARLTGGLSPVSLINTYTDWALHLASSPAKQIALADKAAQNWFSYSQTILKLPSKEYASQKIATEAPFKALEEAHLLLSEWWEEATRDIPGLSDSDEASMGFLAKQTLDAVSPTNFLSTNPELLEKTYEENGANLVRGYRNYISDQLQQHLGLQLDEGPEYKLGADLATTPGKVIYRNHLIELIQYQPSTDKVQKEPVLITPAWIMKYYILDLKPENSLVKYLTDQGFTTYIISWRNPDEQDRDLSMDDYLKMGPLAAIEEIRSQNEDVKIHATGYCLGGTLLSIVAAYLAREEKDYLASLSLFTAQTDFTEAGELNLFINESQLAFLEDVMASNGYLSGDQMAGAFQMLRSRDLYWAHAKNRYLLGEKNTKNDLMTWNADQTRMPARMHSEYLRKLFLHNDLANGRYEVDGRPVSLLEIKIPIFAVGTEKDHVAPWQSAYKIHALTRSKVTFVLTSGGHNAGIVSEPGHPNRRYKIHTTDSRGHVIPVGEWPNQARSEEGSWWISWSRWLSDQSSGTVEAKWPLKNLGDAPGTYIHMR